MADSLRPRVAIGLVHWPVLDKLGNTVTTNVTNFDIHDIARAARTYGVERYYIINKLETQLMFVHRVMDHWRTGEGAAYNAKRKEALEMVKTARTLEEAIRDWGCDPLVVGTCAKARESKPVLSYPNLRSQIREGSRAHFIVFGTGYGLSEDLSKEYHSWLEPIHGGAPDGWRHLSVRSAVSIILDRLLAP